LKRKGEGRKIGSFLTLLMLCPCLVFQKVCLCALKEPNNRLQTFWALTAKHHTMKAAENKSSLKSFVVGDQKVCAKTFLGFWIF